MVRIADFILTIFFYPGYYISKFIPLFSPKPGSRSLGTRRGDELSKWCTILIQKMSEL
jgi:hypothetical protein